MAALLKEYGFAGCLVVLLPDPLLPKQARPAVQQLLRPLRDLRQMNAILACELAERLLRFERLKRHLEFELSTPALALLRHDPSTCALPILADRLYFARGLDSGTNHTARVARLGLMPLLSSVSVYS